MKRAQVVAFGIAGRLEDRLARWAQDRHLWLRPLQDDQVVLDVLKEGGVFVLKVGRDVVREMELLARVTSLLPETTGLVVGDGDNAALAGLAWHLGARWVAMSLESVEELEGVLERGLGR